MEARIIREMAVFVLLLLSALPGCGRRYSFDAGAVDGSYVMPVQETESLGEPSYFRIQINSELDIREGETRLPFMAGNPEDNRCNVQVEVYVDGETKPCYVSEVLQPGEREAYGFVDRDFEAGEYRLTAVFLLFDSETGTEQGQMEAGIALTVSPKEG